MSQKRVAVVLGSLVGTMTLSAGVLLLLEGGAIGTNIPGAFAASPTIAAQLQSATPLQARAWNYIIIYASGDLAASAALLADGTSGGGNPRSPLVRPKANFHFVIDSASSVPGMKDGSLEVGECWKNQETGAPYAAWPDPRSNSFTPHYNAVGICVAADLTRHGISEDQHQTLLQLVRELQHSLNIPSDHVLFQWDIPLDKQFGPSRSSPAQIAFQKRFLLELD